MDYEQTASGVLIPASFATRKQPARALMSELATTQDGRDITRGYVDPIAIQPSTDSVLRTRGGGDYLVYGEVLRDDQVASCFQQRRLAVIGKETKVDPGGETARDKAAAQFVEDQLDHIGWDRVTNMMLFGVYYGFGVAEALWARDGRYIIADKIKVRNRRRFGFDGESRLRMKTFSNPEGELLPDKKFWTFAVGADHDDEPYGLGLGHWCYWPAWFKRNGLKYWLLFLEKFGQPTAKGTYPGHALPHEKQNLLRALSAINTDSGIIVPEGMAIELIEASRSGTADYAQLIDRMDAAIAKVCVGQTASSQGTPGKLGNDELQGDVRTDLVKADADLICESFNRSIVRWLTEWNFPGAAIPRVSREVEPADDQNALAERDAKLFTIGFKPTLKHIQDTYGGDYEEKAEAQPAPPQNAQPIVDDKNKADPQPQVPTKAEFAEHQASPVNAMSTQVAGTLSEPVNSWVNHVRELANKAENLEQLRELLLENYPAMSLDEYATAMAEALAAAKLAGRDSIGVHNAR